MLLVHSGMSRTGIVCFVRVRPCAVTARPRPEPRPIPFPETPHFADVTNARLLSAAELIGVRPQVAQRELDELCRKIGSTMDKTIDEVEAEDRSMPAETAPYIGAEMRLRRHTPCCDRTWSSASPRDAGSSSPCCVTSELPHWVNLTFASDDPPAAPGR